MLYPVASSMVCPRYRPEYTRYNSTGSATVSTRKRTLRTAVRADSWT